MKKITLLVYCLISVQCLMAQRLRISNGWELNLLTNSITEAGEDYPNATYTSDVDETLLRVRILNGNATGTPPTTSYEVNVNKNDQLWIPSLDLKIRRTGNGVLAGGSCPVCPSTIFGGLVYQSVTNSQSFVLGSTVAGENRRVNIPIQYQLSGMSVLLPVRNYHTRIVYTLDPTY